MAEVGDHLLTTDRRRRTRPDASGNSAQSTSCLNRQRLGHASRPGGIALPNAFSVGIQSSWAPGSSETNSVPRTLFDGSFAEISPDGRYIAYQSNESGRYEVYVRRFPDAQAAPWQVSTAGGTRPRWSRDGRDLFFIDEANALTAVPVKTAGAAFVAGAAARLLDGRYLEPNPARHYDVSPDGRRFLMIKPASNGDPNVTPAGLVVVVSWLAELRSQISAT